MIELKSPVSDSRVPDVSSDEVKQLLRYLHAILHKQKTRVFVYGVLTNYKYLVAVKAQRQANGTIEYIIQYASTFTHHWIQFLLEAPLEQLGCKVPTVGIAGTRYELHKYLGSGQHSHGYELDLSGTVVVVKQFAKRDKAVLEKETCKSLVSCVGVSKLHLVQPDDEHFVAITPKGHPFGKGREMNSNHVKQLDRHERVDNPQPPELQNR